MKRDELSEVFDADNHFYEPREALTEYLPPALRGTIRYVEVDGRTKIAVLGQISDYIPNPTFDRVAAPGVQEDYFRHGNPEGKPHRELMGTPIDCLDEFRSPAPRLERLDEQGVQRTIMFPTLASLVEDRFRNDPDAVHDVIHAFNEWLYAAWTFDYAGRIYTTPIITLPNVERAIAELEWVLAKGAHGRIDQARSRARTPWPTLLRPSGVRSVLGPGAVVRCARDDARIRQRIRASGRRVGRRERVQTVPAESVALVLEPCASADGRRARRARLPRNVRTLPESARGVGRERK